jgi:hypothetical protein
MASLDPILIWKELWLAPALPPGTRRLELRSSLTLGRCASHTASGGRTGPDQAERPVTTITEMYSRIAQAAGRRPARPPRFIEMNRAAGNRCRRNDLSLSP